MSDDLIAIIACCILGLIAHGSRSAHWLEWVIRITICVFIAGECLYILGAEPSAQMTTNPYGYSLLVGCAIASTVLLFEPGRKLFSLLFTVIEQIIGGRVLLALMGKLIAPVKIETRERFPDHRVGVAVPATHSVYAIDPAKTDHPVSDVGNTAGEPDASSAADGSGSNPAAGAADGLASSSASSAVANDSVSLVSTSGSATVGDTEVKPEGDTAISEASVGPTGTEANSEAGSAASEPALGGTSSAAKDDPSSAGMDQTAATDESDDDESVADEHPSAPESKWVMQQIPFHKAFFAERIFVPSSIPHMNALWIYVTVIAFLLTHTELTSGFQMPSIMIPLPVSFDQLFSYNFLGLILLSACGVGIFVTRKPMETLRRLGLVRPTFTHVLIGIGGIFMTFAYDYLWSTYTHGQDGMGYADKISHYNEGAFNPTTSASSASALASATGICAGIGEEIISRGALQPVLGILPAAFLHGVLHAQFAHAPMLILQVAGWSTIMGIIRRYTNTTTTIITHVGYNFITTFIFAFNP